MKISGPKRLSAWRTETGLSQETLAGRLGVAQSTLSLWETGGRRPGLPKALEIQALTGIPATAWGYTDDEVARVGAAFGVRAA